jgi:hypothetical protein
LPWKFNKAPKDFWNNKDNQRKFLDWLGKELGFKEMSDWYKVRVEDILQHGAGISLHYNSPRQILEANYPGCDYNLNMLTSVRVPLGIVEVEISRDRPCFLCRICFQKAFYSQFGRLVSGLSFSHSQSDISKIKKFWKIGKSPWSSLPSKELGFAKIRTKKGTYQGNSENSCRYILAFCN